MQSQKQTQMRVCTAMCRHQTNKTYNPILNSPFCQCQNKNTGLRQPQSQPCLSSTGIQRRDHTNVIPSDNSMCAGSELLFDRFGGFLHNQNRTNTWHVGRHGLQSLVALNRCLWGKTPRISLTFWHHYICPPGTTVGLCAYICFHTIGVFKTPSIL